jgi:predicted metal-dependent phosphoesterase TrpH
MRLRIDLHVHTRDSLDSHISLDDAARRCREEDLDGFAVTNHDFFSDIPSSWLKKTDLIILRGMEVSARGAHILALDINEEVEMGLGILETVEKIHEQGGLAIIAHPYSVLRTWVTRREIEAAGFDLVEVANAYQFPYGWMLERNTRLAEELGLPQTGGSDAHIPKTVGRAYTVLEVDERSEEGVLEALRKGKTKAEGRGISLAERLKLDKK